MVSYQIPMEIVLPDGITLKKNVPMKAILTGCFLFIAIAAFSQVEIKTAAELKEHVGDSIKYCGKVASAKLMDRTLHTPTFINMDNPYPNQTLTVVVWGDDRKNFTERPDKFYLNKNVCVYGKLELFKNQVQVTIHSETQMVVQE